MPDVGVIIVSDRAARGEREDTCLPVFEEHLSRTAFAVSETTIVPDDSDAIQSALQSMIDSELALIFTSGGTGCSPRDNTPEATRPLIDRLTPGIDEAIRAFSMSKSPHAAYSRGVSGIAGRSLIINLPGSPKAVGEILEYLLPTLGHPLRLISGEKIDCADESRNHD